MDATGDKLGGGYMKFLAILPDLGPEINAIGQEILRSGHTIYPLMGEVTERQFMEACDPAHGFDGLIAVTHGTREGIMLKPSFGVGQDAVWLPLRAVVAGIQAAGTIKLLVLGTCEGRGLAEEAYWRAKVTTVYSDGPLETPNAYTLAATFLRRLRTGTLDDALAIADTLGLHWYPAQLTNGHREIADTFQEAIALLTRRLDRFEERTERRMDDLDAGTRAIHDKLDNAVLMTPPRRLLWLLGAILFAAPFAVSAVYNLYLHGQSVALAVVGILLSLALATGLLLAGFGRLPV